MNRAMKNILLILAIIILTVILYFGIKGEVPFLKKEKVVEVGASPQIVLISDSDINTFDIEDSTLNDFANDNGYLDLEVFEDHLGYNYDYDVDNGIVSLATLKNTYRFYLETKEAKINGAVEKGFYPIRMIGGNPKVLLKDFAEEIGLEITVNEENKAVMLYDMGTESIGGSIAEDTYLYYEIPGETLIDEGIKVVGKLKKKEPVNRALVLGEINRGYQEVVTQDGKVGYVQTEMLEGVVQKEASFEVQSMKAFEGKDQPIFLVWELIHSGNPNTDKIGELKGVNVISPTWYSLTSGDGKLKSVKGDAYKEWAKGRGYKLWPLFSNSFDLDMTHELLNDAVSRETVIGKLINLYKSNGFDGINIDFENVYLKDKEMFLQFVAELAPRFHNEGMLVSIDVTVEGGSETWSRFLDRKELGKVVDYVAVMTYDEHWASSPKSGSVSSLDWVDANIAKLVQKIDSEKLILGVPFYMRVWHETPAENTANAMKVKSKVVLMNTMNKIIEEKQLSPIWDETEGQYYVAYIEDNIVKKIWIEDERSLRLKAQVVNKYGLAGVGAWARSFPTDNIWNAIDEELNKE